VEISEDIPFLWRLSSDNDQGFSIVSMVIPIQTGADNMEHTIQTDVVSFNNEFGPEQDNAGDEVLEWNEEDLSLFLKLLSERNAVHSAENTHTYKVDLSDPETIEIVHIVAAAGFGMALSVDDLLVDDPGDAVRRVQEPEVGARITLHTVDGYKRGVVVSSEDEEVVCVMQDRINLQGQDNNLSDIHPHDLVVVKPHQLLPAVFSSSEPSPGDVLH
jgi:hypothetical protein